MARVEDLRLAQGGALPVVPPIEPEFNEYADLGTALGANRGGFLLEWLV